MDLEEDVVHFVIPDEDGSRILTSRTGNAICLPKLSQSKEDSSLGLKGWTAETADLCALIYSLLGIDAYVLRMLWDRTDAPVGTREHILVLDPCHYAFSTAEGLTWLHRDQVENARWQFVHKELDMANLLSSYFAETVDGKEPDIRPPWRTRGWLRSIDEWTLSVLFEHGFDMVGPLTQMRNSPYSSVLRCKVKSRDADVGVDVETNTRFICVRTSHPSIPESAISSKLASVLGDFVPEVLAVDDAKHSLIQLDGWQPPRMHPDKLARPLFQLQHRSILFLEDLKEAGVPDRSLEWLRNAFRAIAECRSLDFNDHHDVFYTLTQFKWPLLSLISSLEKLELPLTLVHGQLTSSSICIRTPSERNHLFTDWISCGIGFPFLSFRVGAAVYAL